MLYAVSGEKAGRMKVPVRNNPVMKKTKWNGENAYNAVVHVSV